jgi:hypothetical protein
MCPLSSVWCPWTTTLATEEFTKCCVKEHGSFRTKFKKQFCFETLFLVSEWIFESSQFSAIWQRHWWSRSHLYCDSLRILYSRNYFVCCLVEIKGTKLWQSQALAMTLHFNGQCSSLGLLQLSQPGSPQNGDLRFVDFAAGTRYAVIRSYYY